MRGAKRTSRWLAGRLTQRVALAVTFVAIFGCVNHRKATVAAVESVGPAAIRAAADSLRRPIKREEMQELPRSAWPEAIQRLGPEKVFVEKDGVSIQVYSRFVEGAGLYITFDGAEAPPQGGGDPSFDRLWERIYWYQFVG